MRERGSGVVNDGERRAGVEIDKIGTSGVSHGGVQTVGDEKGKIGLDATEIFESLEGRFEAGFGLAVIDTGTMQHEHRPTSAVPT
ncbi:MAG TPA: hypothetical protein VIP98_09620 [Microlunatus sp.]